jgi:hypothetical protein
MARNMIAANMAIFGLLDRFAADRGAPLENDGQPRWIATDVPDKEILKNFVLSKAVKIDPTRALARFDCVHDNLFVLVGFEQGIGSVWLPPIEVGAGLLTATLAELQPRPIASALEIKQVVDAQDKRDDYYVGHTAADIAGLFPSVRAFQGYNLASDADNRIFFDFLLSETELSNNWIEKSLCCDLRQLIDLDLIGVPYMMVARSMLDFDPSSLFMALYRCLESLYSHTGANKLRTALNITAPWEDIATALESELSWRPIEAQSLEALVGLGDKTDLSNIRDAISPAFPGAPSGDLVRAATDYLYKLRNAVVHYRPVHNTLNHSLVDWTALCRSCATLISYVYSEVFGSM